MAEPNAQRIRITFTVKRADNDRFIIACDPLESASPPSSQGPPRPSEAALAASAPTETEAVIRGVSVTPPSLQGSLHSNSRKSAPKSKRDTWCSR